MLKFEEIFITGMFGRFNVSLPIGDNKMILVVPNGIGKSKVLSAFFYFISRQWKSWTRFNSTR